jgi:hypothetical protein
MDATVAAPAQRRHNRQGDAHPIGKLSPLSAPDEPCPELGLAAPHDRADTGSRRRGPAAPPSIMARLPHALGPPSRARQDNLGRRYRLTGWWPRTRINSNVGYFDTLVREDSLDVDRSCPGAVLLMFAASRSFSTSASSADSAPARLSSAPFGRSETLFRSMPPCAHTNARALAEFRLGLTTRIRAALRAQTAQSAGQGDRLSHRGRLPEAATSCANARVGPGTFRD